MNKQQSGKFPYSIIRYLAGSSWYEPLRRAFWRDPDRLTAIKATVAIALLAIPCVAAGNPFFAVTLALGALAGALSETDDHPRGRIKSLGLKTISFGISSLAVELLNPWPALTGIGLFVATIVFLLIGGLSERYRGITFGAILVGVYAMIGVDSSPAWYWQPVLLTSGALFYGLISLLLLYSRPWRLLEEQLARGFLALSNYLDEKARLFPSDKTMQEEICNRLALHNVQLVDSLERCKEIMNNYNDALKGETTLLKPYMQYFMLLQSLHERAASSHEQYDVLSADPANQQLIEGVGQLMHQLSRAVKKFAACLLTGIKYRHPASLGWTVKVLNDQLEKYGSDGDHPLALLILNLSLSNFSLQNIYEDHQLKTIPRLARDTRSLTRRLKDQLSINHPRMRHAIRLSLCLLMGFVILQVFDLPRGQWIILTSLVVCQPGYSETRRRLIQRIMGTLCGVIGGILAVTLLTTLPGELLLMLCSAYAFFLWQRRNYSISVIFITIFVLCSLNLIDGEGINAMLPRLSDTIIGSVLALSTVRFLWPDWQYKRLPALLTDAISKNTIYFEAILNEYRNAPTDDDLDYRVARRQAHQADNALALSWQNMQMEPRKYRAFTREAFTLTNLNHALLSYISAFGAHRAQQQDNSQNQAIAGAILDALVEAGKSCTEKMKTENTGISDVLDNIRRQLGELGHSGHGKNRQQLILLYNIAEVSSQLLDHAGTLRNASPEREQNLRRKPKTV